MDCLGLIRIYGGQSFDQSINQNRAINQPIHQFRAFNPSIQQLNDPSTLLDVDVLFPPLKESNLPALPHGHQNTMATDKAPTIRRPHPPR